MFFPAIELFGAISTCAVLLVGTRFLSEGTLTIGTLITAIYLLQLVFQPLQELSDVYGQVQAAAAAMVKISSVLDTEPDIGDRPGARRSERIEGRIDLDGVRFSYGDNEVLHGIDIHVPAGGCIALVGQTGGGKSTLAKLIARFYDPSQGTVRMDGIDLREVQLRATAASSAWCCRIRSCSRARSPTTSASPAPRRPTRRWPRPRRRSASTGWRRACTAGSSIRCARAARASRRASGS